MTVALLLLSTVIPGVVPVTVSVAPEAMVTSPAAEVASGVELLLDTVVCADAPEARASARGAAATAAKSGRRMKGNSAAGGAFLLVRPAAGIRAAPAPSFSASPSVRHGCNAPARPAAVSG